MQENGQEYLEDIAEEYLKDLVDRNLVLVVKKREWSNQDLSNT